MRDKLKHIAYLSGNSINEFEGEKKYYSTGNLNTDNYEKITYNNRPARANIKVKENDILIAKMKNTNKTTLVTKKMEDNVYSTGFSILSTKKLDIKYLYYLLNSPEFIEKKDVFSVGTTQVAINDEILMNIDLEYINNVNKQKKIAIFLDKKIIEIDKVMEKTKETIDDYKKYRELVITKTVSLGFNENSNEIIENEVFGKINKKYKIVKFKYVGDIKSNLVKINEYQEFPQISPDKIEKGTGRLLYYNSVKDSNIISDNHLFYKGMIVYSKIRPLLNKAIIADFDGLCSADMYPIESKINKKFLLYYMLSGNFLRQISISNNRVKMPKLNKDELNEIKVIVPDKIEQEKIVKFLDKKCKEIDEIIINKEKLINEMEKYKKSLIYEYVTGKKDVISRKNTEMAELSLRILEQLPNNYSMCKIKLNKIQSVILKMIKYHREPDYKKHAAGPYSKEMMKDVYDTFEKEKWVKLSKEGMRDVYTLDDNYKEGIKRYQEHFKEYDNEITRIIKLFENKDTQESEIIATLFYCWNDFLLDGIQPTDDQIIEQFYSWSKRKKYIKTTKVKKNLTYMRKNNLIPNGYGKKTIQRSNSYGRK